MGWTRGRAQRGWGVFGCAVGGCIGLKGLVFCAALVALVPITVCGDAASTRVATTPHGERKAGPGGIRREVSHVDLNAERVPVTPSAPHAGIPKREVSHADIYAAAPKLELRQGGDAGLKATDTARESHEGGGGQGGESCEGDDVEWQAQIVYSGEVLGVGSFSVVHAARNISSGQQLAVKIVRIPADNAIFIKRLTREVKILREIDHPNIVKLTKVLESPTTCNLFMERCDGGELFTLLEGMEFSDDGLRSLVTSEAAPPQEFTEANIVHIIHQILSAVHHCHQRQIVHRDLKLENVLLVDPWVDGVYPCFAVISCLRSWCASKPQARSVRGMRVRVQTHTRVWTHCCDTWLLCLDMCLCTICAGISYIHTHSRAHTPHPGGRLVKVADFGFAKVLREGEHLISACGRSLYLLFIPSFVPMHTQASFYVEGGCRLAPCI